jgi:hydrogenase nickel incorporation protein HypA/HybF
MHEASLVLGMIPVIEKHMQDNNGVYVAKVTVKIGRLSGVELNSFDFAFSAVKLDYPWLKDAELVVNDIPIMYKCKTCSAEFESHDFNFPTCSCGSTDIELISGTELYLETLEIDKGD